MRFVWNNVLLFGRARGNWREGLIMWSCAAPLSTDAIVTPLPLAAKLKSHRIACSAASSVVVSFFNNALHAIWSPNLNNLSCLSKCLGYEICSVILVNLKANLRRQCRHYWRRRRFLHTIDVARKKKMCGSRSYHAIRWGSNRFGINLTKIILLYQPLEGYWIIMSMTPYKSTEELFLFFSECT